MNTTPTAVTTEDAPTGPTAQELSAAAAAAMAIKAEEARNAGAKSVQIIPPGTEGVGPVLRIDY